MDTQFSTIPTWDEITLPQFSTLTEDIQTDVLIVGGGITGLTTAYLLSQKGLQVTLVEMNSIDSGDTGVTTAMATEYFDVSLSDLEKDYTHEEIELVIQAGKKSNELIKTIISDLNINCDLREVPNFFIGYSEEDRQKLIDEAQIAQTYTLPLQFADKNSLPFKTSGYSILQNQLLFHPRKYLKGIIEKGLKNVKIYENSRATDIEDSNSISKVKVNDHTITAKHVVVATHSPFNAGLIMTDKLAPMTSYVIEATISSLLPTGMYWDLKDPYFYWRVEPSEDIRFDRLILGGLDHRSGEVPEKRDEKTLFEQFIRDTLSISDYTIRRLWSGQVIETVDNLPYIGKYKENSYIATGFWGNGITFGTFSALLITDLITGQKNEFAELFSPNRMRNLIGFMREGLKNAKNVIKAYGKSITSNERNLALEKGTVITKFGKPIAVYKDKDGKVIKLSALCTHMNCIVNWNSNDKSWDCPCHGSKFSKEGDVLKGPATKPLPSLTQ